ncbi:hypothetical protein K8R32_03735 [bacterium]|nr:hypothetical protein [bacterium]
MKNGTVLLDQIEEAIDKLGGKEVLDAWLRGEKNVIVEDANQSLFDKHGRRITKGLSSDVGEYFIDIVDHRLNTRGWGYSGCIRDYGLEQPKLERDGDYSYRIRRLTKCLSIGKKITPGHFRAETRRLLTLIKNNPKIANIVNGVWLPIILPRLTTDNLSEALDQYSIAVNKSYLKTFSGKKYYGFRTNKLKNKVSVVKGCRHRQLIARMKKGPNIAIHFPNPMAGFSIHADREQMLDLPEGFFLSGMDTPIAMVMYADILAGNKAPALDLAALSGPNHWESLYFKSYSSDLTFGGTAHLKNAYICNSGGLLYLPEDE